VGSPFAFAAESRNSRCSTACRRLAAFHEFVQAGLLASYGPNIVEIYRRGATFVDKILKGAKPAELPVEQPPTYELAVNVATARALGLTIPQTLRVRAEHLID
jgi:putative tryptophan/tyrosine transport system substrate-binding protein